MHPTTIDDRDSGPRSHPPLRSGFRYNRMDDDRRRQVDSSTRGVRPAPPRRGIDDVKPDISVFLSAAVAAAAAALIALIYGSIRFGFFECPSCVVSEAAIHALASAEDCG